MDFNKTNRSPFNYEAQKLEAASAKRFAAQYKQAAKDYLNKLCEIDNEALQLIHKILLKTDSYEDKNGATAIKPLISNIKKTGELPHHRINSVADLVDEGKINLYPLNQLTEVARNELSQLCEVASFTNAASSKYIETDLNDLYSDWAVAPPKGKAEGFLNVKR